MGREVGSSIQEIEIGSEMAPRERLRYALKRGSCQGRQQRRPEALASPTGQKVPQKRPPVTCSWCPGRAGSGDRNEMLLQENMTSDPQVLCASGAQTSAGTQVQPATALAAEP